MLVHLAISNYAIVEQLDLELATGMTVITGETGAGKSIMLDALGLALGDRCDSSVVRPHTDKADILASFDISEIAEAQAWLNEHDLQQADKSCLLRRVIGQDGRSRGYINGTPCPLNQLKLLGELLIDIHSQHEHQSLLKLDNQRRLLDEYASHMVLVEQVKKLAQAWRIASQELYQQSHRSQEQQARQALLSYQLEELTTLGLAEGELELLEAEQRNLSQADAILNTCQQVLAICHEDEFNLVMALNTAVKKLTTFKTPVAELDEAIHLFNSAQIQIDEALAEITRFVEHFDVDPKRQLQVEERLDRIYSLARKHHIQPVDLVAFTTQLSTELANLSDADESLEQLRRRVEQLAKDYQQQAHKLSVERHVAADKLAKAVQQKMQSLGMPGGLFAINLTPVESNEPQPSGMESVEFLVSSNPGQPLRSLTKVASGGELSRISLAIQVITAQTSRVPTLVFDEVDVGIGGPTAEIVGHLLREIGEKGQVLVVTHLPQVAAQGHHHLYVHKVRTKTSTQTAVTQLTSKQRVEELARMLGGLDMTKESLAHAQTMFKKAQHN